MSSPWRNRIRRWCSLTITHVRLGLSFRVPIRPSLCPFFLTYNPPPTQLSVSHPRQHVVTSGFKTHSRVLLSMLTIIALGLWSLLSPLSNLCFQNSPLLPLADSILSAVFLALVFQTLFLLWMIGTTVVGGWYHGCLRTSFCVLS